MRTRMIFVALAYFGLIQRYAQAPNPTEVAPGISLPTGGDGTVFVLDTAASGPVCCTSSRMRW